MLIDHINYVIFDHKYFAMSFIGRLAFPLFAYMSVSAYLFYTRSKKNYLLRLFIFALISFPIVHYVFGIYNFPLNILFSITNSLLFLYFYDLKKYEYLGIFVVFSFFTDYSIFGFMMFVSFYLFLKHQTLYTFFLLAVSLLVLNPFYFAPLVPITLSIILLHIYYNYLDFKTAFNKYVFYSFYPLHILFLGFLR